jgi:choline dehydrogenase-like flavoprotein
MGNDPGNSVVDKFGRTHDVVNLFICDGSVMPTQGSANPALTIQSLAARTADYLIAQGQKTFTSDERDMTPPPVLRHLAVEGTFTKGVPRVYA